jgi:hypothetical protein
MLTIGTRGNSEDFIMPDRQVLKRIRMVPAMCTPAMKPVLIETVFISGVDQYKNSGAIYRPGLTFIHAGQESAGTRPSVVTT